MKKSTLSIVAVIITALLIPCSAFAGLKLPRIFAHRMVLQRDTENPVWGTADPEAEVTVTIADQTVKTRANKKGYWRTNLPAMKAGGPYTMTVSAGARNRKTFKNVLIGEVWMCSGQSNMVFRLKGRLGQVPDADQVIAAAKFPRIRWTSGYGWQGCSPASVVKCSAVAFFFARKLHQELEGSVPVGIVNLSYNGSSIESWLPPDSKGRGEGKRFKSRVRHLMGYGIRGAIWYQGESNMGRVNKYGGQLKRLINGWRRIWKQDDLPVAVVQLPPYGKYAKSLPSMWTQQMSILTMPETGFIVTTDVGDLKNIHPPRKQEVGERAALWALANVYGKKDLVWSGPIMKSVEFRDDSAVVTFDHVGGGLCTRDEKAPDGFELAGDDGKFAKAKARIHENTITVSRKDLPNPTKVRFGWNGRINSNLINKEGLPARPFRNTSAANTGDGK